MLSGSVVSSFFHLFPSCILCFLPISCHRFNNGGFLLKGGVGCSINCRCEGCKNAFGRKDGKYAFSEKSLCFLLLVFV